MGVNNCLQCGRGVGSGQGFTDGIVGHVFCSQGCLKAYSQQNGITHPVDAVLGLAGKALGGAIGLGKNKGESSMILEESSSDRALKRAEAERLRAEARAAESAARHVITHEIVCPICDAQVSANMASDGKTKVRCKQCMTRLEVKHNGDITVLGPKDEPLSKAESLDIKEDRHCDVCKFYQSSQKRKSRYLTRMVITFGCLGLAGLFTGWGIVSSIVLGVVFLCMIYFRFDDGFKAYCENNGARDVTGNYSFETPADINRNLRCRFWEKK